MHADRYECFRCSNKVSQLVFDSVFVWTHKAVWSCRSTKRIGFSDKIGDASTKEATSQLLRVPSRFENQQIIHPCALYDCIGLVHLVM